MKKIGIVIEPIDYIVPKIGVKLALYFKIMDQ